MRENFLTMEIIVRVPWMCRVACRVLVALVRLRLIGTREALVWGEFLISRLAYVAIAGMEKRIGDW